MVAAARAAFLEFGVKRTTMADIAHRAGISTATLYRRYSGRHVVIDAVVQREAADLIAAIGARAPATSDPAQQLSSLFCTTAALVTANPLLRRLMHTEPEIVVRQLASNGYHYIGLARSTLADRIRQLPETDTTNARAADIAAEVIVRVALSLILIPDSAIPADDAAIRGFVRCDLPKLIGRPPDTP